MALLRGKFYSLLGNPGHRYNGQTTKHDTPSLTPPPILTPFRTQDFTFETNKNTKSHSNKRKQKNGMCTCQLTRLPSLMT
jgi:hypothetical protein